MKARRREGIYVYTKRDGHNTMEFIHVGSALNLFIFLNFNCKGPAMLYRIKASGQDLGDNLGHRLVPNPNHVVIRVFFRHEHAAGFALLVQLGHGQV